MTICSNFVEHKLSFHTFGLHFAGIAPEVSSSSKVEEEEYEEEEERKREGEGGRK